MLSKMYTNNNEQMVDLATLQTQESIKEIKSKRWRKRVVLMIDFFDRLFKDKSK